ncbi:DNA-binding protein [Endozoicomonas arenosclerae]|uniref:DNA-binding protein n=1 Tax=Endozoicomonas arenosclerae TaxID=1633495 RepID=UPI0007849076|nr:DNA-binding protein [Endozoicomonas arenosclerae]
MENKATAENQKEIQRRELVFRVLDDLKAKGERINADKLARLAKMGKQTVLPYYNEWRFLDDAEKEVDDELPADLVRVLKRSLLQWKHDATASQRDFEDQANQEIDELQQIVHRLSEEQLSLKQQLEAVETENQQLKEANEKQLQYQVDADKEIVQLKEQFNAASQSNIKLEETLAASKEEHSHALSSLETKLDNQYQGQINHWIKTVDSERRLRTDIESKLQKQKDAELAAEKERNEVQYRLEAKSKAHLEACEDRNRYKAEAKESEPHSQAIKELALLLNQPIDSITEAVRHLLSIEQKAKHGENLLAEAVKNQKALEDINKSLQIQLDSSKELEREVERLKGYNDALKLTIEQNNEARS